MVQLAVTLQGFQRHAGNHCRDDVYHFGGHQRQVDDGDRTIGGLIIANVVAQPDVKVDVISFGNS